MSREDAMLPWTPAVTAMCAIQLSSALAVPLVAAVGAAGAAWLRSAAGAVFLLALVRPRLRSIRRPDLPALVGLGVVSGVMSVAFLAAIARIPLGTAVAVEFLGPLTVAALRGRDRRVLVWPFLALLGVVVLTQAWTGDVALPGVALAALAGIGWGSYILLTQRVGDRLPGITGLSITVPIAALTAAVVGVPQSQGRLTWPLVATAVGLGLLHPVLTFALEMLALKRMTATAFGTLMAVEPAIAVLLGLLVLRQQPSALQVVGVALVVVAGAAAQHGGRRRRTPPPIDPP